MRSESAYGALRSLDFWLVDRVEHRPGRAAGVASPQRPAKCAGSPAMLGHVARRELTSLAALGSVQTCAPSPVHEARCARGHAPRASRRCRGAPPAARPGRCERQWDFRRTTLRVWVEASRITTGVCKDAAGRRAQRLWGGEERRPGGRARSANQALTHRGWSSAVSKANEASSAMRPPGRAPQRSPTTGRTATAKRSPPPGRGFARTKETRPTAMRRQRPPATTPRLMLCGSVTDRRG